MVASGQSAPASWRFVYPNAKALIGINWQRIRQSPAGAMIRDKWLNGSGAAAIPGIEFLNNIDRVVVSSPGNQTNEDTGDGTAVEPAEAPLLIAVEGHFDAAKVRRLFTRLGTKPQAYDSYQVYRPQGEDAKDMAYVLFDSGTIVFGDAPALFAALDRSRFPAPQAEPGSIIARGAELDATYDAWLVSASLDILSNDWLGGLFREDQWAADAQGVEAGVQLRSGLAADVTLRFASEAAAKQMAVEMTRLTAVAAKDKDDPRMRDIARNLGFSSAGPTAKITLRLSPQELEESAQALAVAHPLAMPTPALAASTAPATVAPATVAPTKPGVIRIEGLDDGPREIPYPDPQH
jgi:hypothetical protein